MLSKMQKIIVIGCPGSGKSTFARALHEKTGIQLFHLDMMYWNKDKSIVERDVFLSRLTEAMSKERWIIDGNYSSTVEMRISACDTVFFLDYPLEVCLDGIEKRRGKPRSDMPWTETENDPEFIEFIKGFGERQRPQLLQLLEKHKDKNIVIFSSRSQANSFLKTL